MLETLEQARRSLQKTHAPATTTTRALARTDERTLDALEAAFFAKALR